jgi:hypothetical protein
MRFLHWFGSKAEVAEVVKFALEVRIVICPERFENLDHLIGMAPPCRKRYPQGSKFLTPPAHAHATDQPTIGQGINRGEHFRHHHRITMAQDKDR